MAPWGPLEPLGDPLGPLGSPLEPLGDPLGPLGTSLGSLGLAWDGLEDPTLENANKKQRGNMQKHQKQKTMISNAKVEREADFQVNHQYSHLFIDDLPPKIDVFGKAFCIPYSSF